MLSREDLIALVTKIQEGLYPSEAAADADIEILTKNVIDPAAIDYLFQKEYENLSPEQIADKILSYQPIRL